MMQHKTINLQPGEVYFSQVSDEAQQTTKIKTILGSCVAVTIWHASSQTGGMCHYLLAQESEISKKTKKLQKYRYGDEALDYLLKKMSLIQPINEFEISLFGGSNMYISSVSPSIGENNIALAQIWATKNKLVFKQEDTLGNLGRSINLDLTNGNIEISKYPIEPKEL